MSEQKMTGMTYKIQEMARRIRELREITGLTVEEAKEAITAKLEAMGVIVEEFDEAIRIFAPNKLTKIDIKTLPYPGFPTDMQPQFAVLLSIARGNSMVSESVWDNRFRYVDQLLRMGARITVDGKSAFIEGVEGLKGAPVIANDLRAGAAMVIAGLVASGTTEIEEIHHIQRGYDNIIEKLRSLGADIELRNSPDDEKTVLSVG